MAEHKQETPFIRIRGGANSWETIITDRDGRPIEDVAAASWQLRAGGSPKVTLEFYRADIDVEGRTDAQTCVFCQSHYPMAEIAAPMNGQPICRGCLSKANHQSEQRQKARRG